MEAEIKHHPRSRVAGSTPPCQGGEKERSFFGAASTFFVPLIPPKNGGTQKTRKGDTIRYANRRGFIPVLDL
jgi:hypothetical protein